MSNKGGKNGKIRQVMTTRPLGHGEDQKKREAGNEGFPCFSERLLKRRFGSSIKKLSFNIFRRRGKDQGWPAWSASGRPGPRVH